MDKLKGLTLLEASELVKEIEDTFGVDADAGGAAEEKTEFSVMLTEVPADKKIAILKIVRGITGLGLKEAKEMVEKAPVEIKADAAKDDAENIKSEVEAVGGKVELK